MKRDDSGAYVPIASEQALDEIAAKVSELIAKHGSRSVAVYFGTGVMTFYATAAIAAGWLQAIGSPMIFSATTIDKPGQQIAQAAHGNWLEATRLSRRRRRGLSLA